MNGIGTIEYCCKCGCRLGRHKISLAGTGSVYCSNKCFVDRDKPSQLDRIESKLDILLNNNECRAEQPDWMNEYYEIS